MLSLLPTIGSDDLESAGVAVSGARATLRPPHRASTTDNISALQLSAASQGQPGMPQITSTTHHINRTLVLSGRDPWVRSHVQSPIAAACSHVVSAASALAATLSGGSATVHALGDDSAHLEHSDNQHEVLEDDRKNHTIIDMPILRISSPRTAIQASTVSATRLVTREQQRQELGFSLPYDVAQQSPPQEITQIGTDITEDQTLLLTPQARRARRACYVCCATPGDHVFLPCGHAGICSECARVIMEGDIRRPQRRPAPMDPAAAGSAMANSAEGQSARASASIVSPEGSFASTVHSHTLNDTAASAMTSGMSSESHSDPTAGIVPPSCICPVVRDDR